MASDNSARSRGCDYEPALICITDSAVFEKTVSEANQPSLGYFRSDPHKSVFPESVLDLPMFLQLPDFATVEALSMSTTTNGQAYNYKVVRQFVVATVFWGVVGMAMGVWIASQLV
ncbi:hypothetical protein ACW9HW_28040, partial [Pseudomonas sp. SDO5532_S415]